jgi:hypothetical protein
VCGKGFYNGFLGGHHKVLPLHGARQVSGGSEFNPPFKFVINEHPERNPISGTALHGHPTDKKLGMPLFHSNGTTPHTHTTKNKAFHSLYRRTPNHAIPNGGITTHTMYISHVTVLNPHAAHSRTPDDGLGWSETCRE